MTRVAPHLNQRATVHHFAPPPPQHLGGEEQEKLWNNIVREHNFNHVGLMLLESALRTHARAEEVQKIIDRDGPVLVSRKGLPRKHPLLGLEIRLRQTFFAT